MLHSFVVHCRYGVKASGAARCIATRTVQMDKMSAVMSVFLRFLMPTVL